MPTAKPRTYDQVVKDAQPRPFPPGPWTVGDKPNPRSMFPIRDAEGHAVAYAYRREVAEAIVRFIGGRG